MKASVLLGALLLAGCAATAPLAPPPAPAEPPKTDPAAKAEVPTLPAPTALAEGDRWFVAIRKGSGSEPVAERSRRTRGGGFVREEVTWGRSFADLAKMVHGTAQVFALLLDAKGLSVSRLDEGDRPFGEAGLEVAAPFRGGNGWTVEVDGRTIDGRIVGLEKVDTPGGTVEALRVEVSAPNVVWRTWYDAGLRPVRSEMRLGGGEVLESRAALASAAPTPEECKAAMEWARKNLPAPGK